MSIFLAVLSAIQLFWISDEPKNRKRDDFVIGYIVTILSIVLLEIFGQG